MPLSELVYTVLLKSAPLRGAANSVIRAIIPRALPIDGVRIALNPDDPVVSGALTLRVYERSESILFQSLCSEGMNVLDIGANVGYYTALAIKCTKNRGSIIAVEPDRESFRFLRQTVAVNRGRNVILVNRAAASRAGQARLFVSRDNRGDSRLYDHKRATWSVIVPTISIDELLEERQIPSVDLVKIDVQGFESHVLEGMADTLRRSPCVTVLSEFWPHGLESAGSDARDYLDLLESHGLQLFEVTSKGRLKLLIDKTAFIAKLPGRHYANILATKVPERMVRYHD